MKNDVYGLSIQSCFTSFQLKITDEATVQLISTSYGAAIETENYTHHCHQYITTDDSINCSATENYQKMCPLLEPFQAKVPHTLTVLDILLFFR